MQSAPIQNTPSESTQAGSAPYQSCQTTPLAHVPELVVCGMPPQPSCVHQMTFGDVYLCNHPKQ